MDNKTRIEKAGSDYALKEISTVGSKQDLLTNSYIAGATAERQHIKHVLKEMLSEEIDWTTSELNEIIDSLLTSK